MMDEEDIDKLLNEMDNMSDYDMDMSSNDIVMNNANDITNNDVECTLRNYIDKTVNPQTSAGENVESVRKKLCYDEINNENDENITENTGKNIVDEEISLSNENELVFDGVEVLSADDSNDLEMDYAVTVSKESMAVSYKRKLNQKLRMTGDPYLGYSRSKRNQILQNVNRLGKTIRPACNSDVCRKSQKRKCNEIAEVNRLGIFNHFWKNLNWDEKKTYVTSLIITTPVKQRTVESSRRNSTMSYNLKVKDAYLCVCKTMFLNTLGLGEKQVLTWCLTAKDTELNIYETNKEKNKRSTMRITPEKIKRKFVTEFLEKLPKLPSHYCRKSTSRLYFEPYIKSISQLYNIYGPEKSEKF
ncbi:hypothetical protein ACI65C_013801 [Semiaphis heraclei]